MVESTGVKCNMNIFFLLVYLALCVAIVISGVSIDAPLQSLISCVWLRLKRNPRFSPFKDQTDAADEDTETRMVEMSLTEWS